MKENILVYVRPWNSIQFSMLANLTFKDHNAIITSEHRVCDGGYFDDLYSAYLRDDYKLPNAKLSISQSDDIIKRCRLLRELNKDEALAHVTAAYLAYQDIFSVYKPKFVLSLTVDSFLLDILSRVAEKNCVKFIGLIPTFVNGFFRITVRGEANETLQLTSDSHAIDTLKKKLLKKSYTPSFNKTSIKSPFRSTLMRWFKNTARIFYFWAKLFISNNKNNYHIRSSFIVSKFNLNIMFPKVPVDPQWRNKILDKDNLKIFIPLQMFPECTIDYWTKDPELISYYDVLLKISSLLEGKAQLFFKEHPSVVGARDASIYRKLNLFKNVSFVPTSMNSNDIILSVDAVLVWTGTIGFEAAIRGKPVFTLGEPYYEMGPLFSKFNFTYDQCSDIRQSISLMKDQYNEKNIDALFVNLSNQLLKGNFKNNGSWNVDSDIDVADTQDMANSLKCYLNV